jgi:hypothetical protein
VKNSVKGSGRTQLKDFVEKVQRISTLVKQRGPNHFGSREKHTRHCNVINCIEEMFYHKALIIKYI